MNWKLNDNSLFAILLRSSWWISFAIAGAVTAVAVALLPEAYRIVGAVTGLPFLVIGCIAAWKQLQAPSDGPHRQHARRGSCDVVGRIFRAPSRRPIGGTDTESAPSAGPPPISRSRRRGAPRSSAASAGRWRTRASRPSPSLHAMKEARDAHECIYVAAGEITDNARAFAGQARDQAGGRPRARAAVARRRRRQEGFMTH